MHKPRATIKWPLVFILFFERVCMGSYKEMERRAYKALHPTRWSKFVAWLLTW